MVKENDPTVNPTFIVKPDGGSQGDGIYLIREPTELKLMAGPQAKQAVVQEYIQRPLLIDKLKFDIRLYVLIKSMEPLEIYIAKEGLTRFCTEPYQVGLKKRNISSHSKPMGYYSINLSDNHCSIFGSSVLYQFLVMSGNLYQKMYVVCLSIPTYLPLKH